MANGSGGGTIADLLKLIFGDVPAQWLRLVIIGGLITWGVVSLRDFSRETRAYNTDLRNALTEYIAANTAWQAKTIDDRRYLIGKVNARFDRIYKRNGMEYEPMEAPR